MPSRGNPSWITSVITGHEQKANHLAPARLSAPCASHCYVAIPFDVVFADDICEIIFGRWWPVVKYCFAKFRGVIWVAAVLNQSIHKFSVAILHRTMNGSIVNLAYCIWICATSEKNAGNVHIVEFACIVQRGGAHFAINLIRVKSMFEAERYTSRKIFDHKEVEQMFIAHPACLPECGVTFQ